MKFLNKSIYALSLVSMMGLWSCSQEDVLQGGDVTASGHSVPVTLTVNRSDAQTRTVLSENTATGGLNDIWVTGDVLHVYNKAGEDVGTLTLQEGENTSVGVFSGLVNADQGEQELNLWYYGDVESNPNLSSATYSGRNALKVDLHTQNFADVKALSALDILSKGVTLNVNGEKSTVVKDETLEAHLALARLSLKGLPEGAKGKLNIYNVAGYGSNADTGEEYYNTLNTTTLDFARLGKAQTTTDKKDIEIENVESGKDVYVAFVPSEGYQLGFVFTNAADGKKYTFAFENNTELEAGKYYCAFASNDNISGVEITLEEEKVEVVDHSKNPLAKWAEANLVQISSTDGASSKSYIPKTSSTKGSLYQWGRNKGWKDYVAARDYVTKLGNATYALTNFEGEINEDTGKLDFDYGTGLGQLYLNNQDYIVTPSMYGLTTVEDIVENPEYWIMNGQITNTTGDYWIGLDGGFTWSERAKAGGFEYESPAPEGWRLPTKAEFLQITPKYKTIDESEKTLKSELNNYTELREIPNTCKYVIRWNADDSGINISALVVSDNFTASNIDDINWNDTNVVKRFFPYTGVIRSSVISCTPKDAPYYELNQWNTVKMSGWFSFYANMYPLGDLAAEEYCSNYDQLGNYLYGYYFSAKINVKTNHNDKVGAYWVSDAKEAFYFNTNENWSGQTTRFSVQGKTSNIHSVRADNGYAIRCVKDN